MPLRLTPQARYLRLGQLWSAFPELTHAPMPDDTLRWCAQFRALLGDAVDVVGITHLDSALKVLRSPEYGSESKYAAEQEIKTLLFNAIAEANLSAPAGSSGAFIPAGNAHDAITAISTVIGEAKKSVLIVDPYMDHKTLQFALLAPEGIALRLLADAEWVKPDLAPAAKAWIKQYAAKRPLEAKVTPRKSLHDRLVTIDGKTVFLLTQSLNAFAARSPATIQRVDADSAAMKIAAYEKYWSEAKLIDA